MNETTLTQTIYISDTEAPTLNVPPVINIEHNLYDASINSQVFTQSSGGVLIDWTSDAVFTVEGGIQATFQIFDDCTFDYNGQVIVTWTDTELGDYDTCLDLPTGEVFQRQYTATDACGNQSMADQIVILVDTTAPAWPPTVSWLKWSAISQRSRTCTTWMFSLWWLRTNATKTSTTKSWKVLSCS